MADAFPKPGATPIASLSSARLLEVLLITQAVALIEPLKPLTPDCRYLLRARR